MGKDFLVNEHVIAGAHDAAKDLGYEITGHSVSDLEGGETIYGFTFNASGQQASVEFPVNEADVRRFGLTPREYARWEILDALRNPDPTGAA